MEIDRKSLTPGDHILAYRKLHSYSHHGIFIGEDRVIHYHKTKEAGRSRRAKPCRNCGVDSNHLRGVVKTCVDCFLKAHIGHKLRLFQYGVKYLDFLKNRPGTCTTGTADPPDVTISRANDYLNRKVDFGIYHLLDNNCEMFAVDCKTGKKVSDQASSAEIQIKAYLMEALERVFRDVSCRHGSDKNDKLKIALDRLLRDVSVHYGPDKRDELKQTIDNLLANRPSVVGQIITHLDPDHTSS